MSDEVMVMWTIYDRPTDFPHCYVARKHVVEEGGSRPTVEVMVATDLEQVREELARRGLFCLPRNEADEPHIVETWL